MNLGVLLILLGLIVGYLLSAGLGILFCVIGLFLLLLPYLGAGR